MVILYPCLAKTLAVTISIVLRFTKIVLRFLKPDGTVGKFMRKKINEFQKVHYLLCVDFDKVESLLSEFL